MFSRYKPTMLDKDLGECWTVGDAHGPIWYYDNKNEAQRRFDLIPLSCRHLYQINPPTKERGVARAAI